MKTKIIKTNKRIFISDNCAFIYGMPIEISWGQFQEKLDTMMNIKFAELKTSSFCDDQPKY